MPKTRYKKRDDGRYEAKVTAGYNAYGEMLRIPAYGYTVSEVEDRKDYLKALFKENTLMIENYTGKASGLLEYIENQKLEEERREFRFKSITFGEYADEWFKTYKSSSGIRTKEMYGNIVYNHLKPFNKRAMRELTRTDIQKLINEKDDMRRTCEQIKLTLNQIFESAVEDNVIDTNPYKRIALPEKVKTEKRALTDIEKEAIRKADFTDMERAFVYLLKGCGLRQGEAKALKPLDFDFKNGTVRVDEAITYDKNDVVWKGPKTEAGFREVYMPDYVEDELKKYITSLDTPILFPMSDGGALSKSAYRCFWLKIEKKIRIAAGETVWQKDHNLTIQNQKITGLTPYVFRHNYCTDLYYSDVSLKEAIRLMGHSSTKMVLEVYTHLDEKRENTKEKIKSIIAL